MFESVQLALCLCFSIYLSNYLYTYWVRNGEAALPLLDDGDLNTMCDYFWRFCIWCHNPLLGSLCACSWEVWLYSFCYFIDLVLESKLCCLRKEVRQSSVLLTSYLSTFTDVLSYLLVLNRSRAWKSAIVTLLGSVSAFLFDNMLLCTSGWYSDSLSLCVKQSCFSPSR